jgi:hypothetical protein
MRALELALWGALLLWLSLTWWRIYHTARDTEGTKRQGKRRLKARSPDDCPACQSEQGLRTVNGVPRRAVRPWSEVKGKGGRKKESNTQGHAFPTKRARITAFEIKRSRRWSCRRFATRRARSGGCAERPAANVSRHDTTPFSRI